MRSTLPPAVSRLGRRLSGFGSIISDVLDVGKFGYDIYNSLEQQELREDALKLQRQQVQAQIDGAKAAQEFERQRLAALAQQQAGDTGRGLVLAQSSGVPTWVWPVAGATVIGGGLLWFFTRGGR